MNTTGTGTYGSSWRQKYFSSNLQSVLRNALVAEKVCNVDRSNSFYIHNPYSNQPTATVQAVNGTYAVSAWTITDDTLTVTDEAIYGEHVFDFEKRMSNYDLMANRFDEMAYAVAYGIDKYVVNGLCEDGTGTYTTPAGGFTTAANVPVIISNLASKVMGFAEAYNGLFLIVENTDVPGFIQAQLASGFSYSDAALRNGFMTSYAGVDIYVVRSGTFVSATIGTRSDFTNSGHRVFGVKNMATYAVGTPCYEEKGVSGKTGKEIAYGTTFGFKLWAQKAGLVIDITLA
jgi:hypothetical protein